MNKFFSKIISIIVLLIILSTFAILFIGCESNNVADNFEITNVQLTFSRRVTIDNTMIYDINVKGTATNNSNNNYSRVTIEYIIYDNNDNNVGTAVATGNNILKGNKWSFTAKLSYYSRIEPKKFTLYKISAE